MDSGRTREGFDMNSGFVREFPEAFLSTSRTVPEHNMVST